MPTETIPDRPLARVREIETKKLFGLYDHTVPLSLQDRVTIVHGANGVGKTILLRLMQALFSQDYLTLLSVPYEKFSVTLVDGRKFQVTPTRAKHSTNNEEKDSEGQPVRGIRIVVLTAEGHSVAEFEVRTDQLAFQQWAQNFAAKSPFLHAMGPDRYYDPRSETQYSALELWRLAGADSGEPVPTTVGPSTEYQAHISAVKTYFVEAQRLMRLTPAKRQRPVSQVFTPAVTVDAQEISSRIRDAFTQYGRISQRLDQTFPQRLMFDWRQKMSPAEIKTILSSTEDEQKRLADLGISDPQSTYQFPMSELDDSEAGRLDAMGLFVTDGKEKLKPLIEFASRIQPLLSNINAKFKNKAVRLDRERGLVAKAADGAEIKPDQLSSGEQHELVMLFHLLFRVSPNTLVLIDEPELSLHIDWQRRFLPELLEIAARTGIDALVATHSPSIVGERDDLMINLESSNDSIG